MGDIENILITKLQEVNAELKSISTIKFGDYYNVSLNTPQKSNIITSLTRTLWFTHESREITLAYVTNLIDKSFNLIEEINNEVNDRKILNSRASDMIKSLKTAILNSQNGINNLKGIYHRDAHTINEITTLLKNIKMRYLNMQEIYTIDNEHDVMYYSPYESPVYTKPIQIWNEQDEKSISKTPE